MSGAEYLRLLEIINESLNAISGFICSRSCCHQSCLTAQGHGQNHTYIGLSKHIWYGEKFSEEEILSYENNIKHGVIHGVSTFIAYNIINNKCAELLSERIVNKSLYSTRRELKISNSPDEEVTFPKIVRKKEVLFAEECYNNPTKEEKILVACLMHDFLKCSQGHENHDKDLIRYFPRIDEVALRHSDPSKEDELEPLVLADRLELLRYPGHESWIDYNKVFKN